MLKKIIFLSVIVITLVIAINAKPYDVIWSKDYRIEERNILLLDSNQMLIYGDLDTTILGGTQSIIKLNKDGDILWDTTLGIGTIFSIKKVTNGFLLHSWLIEQNNSNTVIKFDQRMTKYDENWQEVWKRDVPDSFFTYGTSISEWGDFFDYG